MKKLLKFLDDFKFLIGIYVLAAIFYFEASSLVFGFLIFSILGVGCFFICYDPLIHILKNLNKPKTILASGPIIFYILIGCGCFYISYGALSSLLNF